MVRTMSRATLGFRHVPQLEGLTQHAGRQNRLAKEWKLADGSIGLASRQRGRTQPTGHELAMPDSQKPNTSQADPRVLCFVSDTQ